MADYATKEDLEGLERQVTDLRKFINAVNEAAGETQCRVDNLESGDHAQEVSGKTADLQAQVNELKRLRKVDVRAFGEQVKRIDALEAPEGGPTFVCSVPYGEEPVDGWRDTKPIHHERGALDDRIYERWNEGNLKHGDTFQGEPLSHLEEELIDALFYTAAARRQLAAANDLLRRWDAQFASGKVGPGEINACRDDTAEYLASLDN